MEKILYLSFVDQNDETMQGVRNKIFGQLNVFKNHFDAVYYSMISDENMLLFNGENIIQQNIKKNTHPSNRINNRSSYYAEITSFLNKEHIKYLYIRYNFSCPFFLLFLKKCKKMGVEILLEFPTYPYIGEIKRNKPVLIIDWFFAKFLFKYVNRIITFSNHDVIYRVPTIKIANGIDLANIKLKTKGNYEENVINLIAVANINRWHGYDRIIEGLYKYYSKPQNIKVKFTIVGLGAELNNLKELVSKRHLEDKVIFKGFLTGKELDEEYEKANIGIISLGIHRINLKTVSTLKSKEYWARGLPMIKSYKDEELDNKVKEYILNFPSNDEPINIDEVIKFWNSFENNQSYLNLMRTTAENNVSWDKQLNLVLKYLKGEE